jgi:hypothetical protein
VNRKWNDSAGFPTQYPVLVTSDDAITALDSGSIALDTEYLGSDDIMRNAFVGLAIDGDTDAEAKSGVYRLKDTLKESVKTGVFIHSVAYDGTNLAAGTFTGAAGAASTTVWRSDDPMATLPSTYPSSSLKSPGGENRVVVGWAGANLYAGTSGDESAFAVSRNNGKSFNDLSLIDTAITDSKDVALSADGSKIYWVTDDDQDLSVWRKASGWERILSVQATEEYIVRIAPGNPDAVYVAKTGGTTIYYSKDGGEEKWFTRICGVPVGIQDLAVESADVAYALNAGGDVCGTTNSGFTWGPPTATKLASGYSIVSVSENNLLVGSQAGSVSYSTDGNRSWSDIKKPVEALAGNVILAADSDYANNNIIYAARDVNSSNIMRYTIGTSTDWDDILGGIGGLAFSATEKCYGLATQGGVLYALVFDTGDNESTLYQCLTPTIANKTMPAWETEDTSVIPDAHDADVTLGNGSTSPNALRVSAGSNMAWAVKTNGTNKLYKYNDVLGTGGPSLISPHDGYSIPMNTVSGVPNDIAFYWSRLSNADNYNLYIAYDSAFTQLVMAPQGVAFDTPTVSNIEAGNQFMPGTVYYWRVKATNPLNSPYSETRMFTVEQVQVMVPSIGSPANGANNVSTIPAFSWSPVSGATMYEFQLSIDTTFASPIASATIAATGIQPNVKLGEGKTYFWRVRALEPLVGGWSTIANFTVAVPAEPTEPIVIPAPEAPIVNIPPIEIPPPEVVVEPAPEAPAPISPGLLWAVIIIGAILVIALIVLIIRTRRAV